MVDANDFASVRKDLKHRMDKTIDVLKQEFSGLRAGRASTGLLDAVVVDAYGSKLPVNQVGNIGVVDSRMLSVQVWDKGLIKAVEKGILEANLGLNPIVDGQTVRIPIPPLSEERRNELKKVASKYTENARVAIRNVRREGMEAVKKMQKDGAISEDEQRKFENEVQKMTDDSIKEMDDALASKEKDIMQV
ncbi:MAG: ribosome recycling factor [Alphaproteobacteria bacterium]